MNQAFQIYLGRYPKSHYITTNLDLFQDAISWINFLCSKDYLHDLLSNTHDLSTSDSRERISHIIPHAESAISYIKSALSTDNDISYLLSYYGILNLIKIYILLGSHHKELPRQRWHGATYNVNAKDSRSITTEFITIKEGGAIPLFYKTITNHNLPKKNINLDIGTSYIEKLWIV